MLNPKIAVKWLLSTKLGWRVSRRLVAPGVTVLMYHRVDDGPLLGGLAPRVFRNQMRWLKVNCEVIALDQFPTAIEKNDGKRIRVAVTFDDGFRDYYLNAYPVLDELQLPATMFLATSFIDTGGLLWTDQVDLAFNMARRRSQRLPWSGELVLLSSQSDRSRAAMRVKSYLKCIPDRLRREQLGALIADMAPDSSNLGRQMLNWSEVRSMRTLTTFGGHSHTHPILSQLSYADALNEVKSCRDRLTSELGTPPRFFAYPNGSSKDFNDDTRRAVAACGFELACSTIHGRNGPGQDLLAIKRQPTGARVLPDFASLVAAR